MVARGDVLEPLHPLFTNEYLRVRSAGGIRFGHGKAFAINCPVDCSRRWHGRGYGYFIALECVSASEIVPQACTIVSQDNRFARIVLLMVLPANCVQPVAGTRECTHCRRKYECENWACHGGEIYHRKVFFAEPSGTKSRQRFARCWRTCSRRCCRGRDRIGQVERLRCGRVFEIGIAADCRSPAIRFGSAAVESRCIRLTAGVGMDAQG